MDNQKSMRPTINLTEIIWSNILKIHEPKMTVLLKIKLIQNGRKSCHKAYPGNPGPCIFLQTPYFQEQH